MKPLKVKRNKKSKKVSIRKRRIGRILAGACVIAIVAALFWYALADLPFGKQGSRVWVNIPEGMSTADIASLLQTHHVINSGFWFRVYLFLTRQGDDLQAGNYEFISGMSQTQVAAELRRGAVAFNTVTVTIPEGFTTDQIATLLSVDGVSSRSAFLRAVNHGVFPFTFVSRIPHNKSIRARLEGYLFPDTYDFVRDESPYQVVSTMLQETNAILTPGVIRAAAKEHLNVEQLLTIASMIEREAKLERERPIIASVIFNRLYHVPPMKLQIDATVQYALGGSPRRLTLEDLTINSPYNTYLYPGLPPSPIANPGLASIEAVLHPAHTDYYYYVARYDGTGGHFFATTYLEQMVHEAESQANYAKGGR